jgi:hypothetical protein
MNYLSTSQQDFIYNISKLNHNITSIIITYLTNKISWKKIQYNESYIYIPRTLSNINLTPDGKRITFNIDLILIKKYSDICKQLLNITNKYIDVNNIWDKCYSFTDSNKIIPLLCSSIKYDAKYYENFTLTRDNGYYTHKLSRTIDAYKTFTISLFPNNKEEIITHACLYIPYMNMEIPICELIQIDDNKFTLPGYLSLYPYMDYFVKFKIENDLLENNDLIKRLINVEQLMLNNDSRQAITNEYIIL